MCVCIYIYIYIKGAEEMFCNTSTIHHRYLQSVIVIKKLRRRPKVRKHAVTG